MSVNTVCYASPDVCKCMLALTSGLLLKNLVWKD